MAQCLMLDVDGVAVTGHPEDGRSWAADIEQDLGIDPHRLQDVFFAPCWGDIVLGRKNLMDALRACLPTLSASVTPEEFLEYWFSRDARLNEAVIGACDVLRRRGWRIFFATNQEHLRARYLMERLGLGRHVDGMIYSARIGAKKPEGAFFKAAARISGAAPEKLILVDDSESNVAAARQAGWAAHHWTDGDDLLMLLQDRKTG
ncbi:HAD-IA family hydrolase [Methyloligella halotolerans]|uniref:HAD-IA family hydrolase n=1 Tax=Methyloligella halotolerans TaxID=1177755 RepID=UPI00114D36A7|nr:HAD-IA family hydrolase [Methyloligella halotolerans]